MVLQLKNASVYTGGDKASKRAIGLKEIKKITPEDLNNMSVLDFARDIFLFSFYTREMSFIVIAYLKKKDFSNGFVVTIFLRVNGCTPLHGYLLHSF